MELVVEAFNRYVGLYWSFIACSGYGGRVVARGHGIHTVTLTHTNTRTHTHTNIKATK